MAAVKIGPLAEQALSKNFPQRWEAVAAMLGLEYEFDETTNRVVIHTEHDSMQITQDGQLYMTAQIDDRIIMAAITHVAKTQKTGAK